MPVEQIDAIMRAVGRHIATKWSTPTGDLRKRLELAVDVLNELGGLAELEQRNGTYIINGYSCPLAAAVPGHPQVCSLAETLLTELIGVPVQEHCSREQPLQCHFVIPVSDAAVDEEKK